MHDYTLDPASRELRHGAHRMALEPQVFQVLLFLLEHRDRVVPKAAWLEQCWPETFVSESALTQCLVRLRKAVQATPTAPPVIETLHRQGYRFVAEVTALAQRPPPAPVDTALPHASPALQGSVHPVPLVSSDTPAPPATRAPAAHRAVVCGGGRHQPRRAACPRSLAQRPHAGSRHLYGRDPALWRPYCARSWGRTGWRSTWRIGMAG